jgi:hypothetical protein
MQIVVIDVLGEDQPQVPFAGEQHPIGAPPSAMLGGRDLRHMRRISPGHVVDHSDVVIAVGVIRWMTNLGL